MNILVTGGAGYIGSHTHHLLCELGHRVAVLDNLYSGGRWAIHEGATFYHGDVADTELLSRIFDEQQIDSVIHFAAFAEVEESVRHPHKYYFNNTLKTASFFQFCRARGPERFVFSSTSSVYGQPERIPITEATPTDPLNPYGRSKLMSEWMIKDGQLPYMILRYFNVAGAHPKGHLGQAGPSVTHLIRIAAKAASGERDKIKVFGTDYDTHDGTCIRDYIHVMDLAQIHIQALEHLNRGGSSDVINCGYGRGYSVREVIEVMRRVSGVDFVSEDADRRPGDPAVLIADNSKLRETLEFEPQFDELGVICESAYLWEKHGDSIL